jgi:hypothetical protein
VAVRWGCCCCCCCLLEGEEEAADATDSGRRGRVLELAAEAIAAQLLVVVVVVVAGLSCSETSSSSALCCLPVEVAVSSTPHPPSSAAGEFSPRQTEADRLEEAVKGGRTGGEGSVIDVEGRWRLRTEDSSSLREGGPAFLEEKEADADEGSERWDGAGRLLLALVRDAVEVEEEEGGFGALNSSGFLLEWMAEEEGAVVEAGR